MVNLLEKVLFFGSFVLFVSVSFGKLTLKNVRSHNRLSYAEYKPWSLRGEFTFVFKTNHTNGLLAYQDDGQSSFIEIFLVDGNVRLKTAIGDCKIREIFLRENYADRHWHRIRVQSRPMNFTISVDGEVAAGSVPCSPPNYGPNTRPLYVANFPPMAGLNLNLFVFPGTFHEASYYRFEGCIGDLWITDNDGKLVQAEMSKSSGVSSGCESACSMQQANRCQHQGKCVDEIGRVKCECLETGYEGPFCSEPSPLMRVNGSGYIQYDVGTYQPGRSTLGNNITFRFATTSPWGVVMFTDMANDHVIVELADGFLRVSWDLGQGGLVLMSRTGCLHDGAWHTVTITRYQRRITINLDDQRRIKALIPGKFSFLDFKGGQEMMFFGGGPTSKTLTSSLSRANFTGFLQQLFFDEFDVLNATLSGENFTLIGEAVLSKSAESYVNATKPVIPENCTRAVNHHVEDPCEGVDDEDLCETTVSGIGPDQPDCEKTDGICTTPNTQENTDGPSVVLISPVASPSAVPLTSSTIHPSPSREMRSRMISTVAPFVSNTSKENPVNISQHKTSQNTTEMLVRYANISSESRLSAAVIKSSANWLRALRSDAELTMRSTQVAQEQNTNNTNLTTTFLAMTPTKSVYGNITFSVLTMNSRHLNTTKDNGTTLARGKSDRSTGSPKWVIGVLIIILLNI